MFQGLESHSVLHVLHKSVSLAHLPEKEVFELLRKRPVFTPVDAGTSSGVWKEANEVRFDETLQAEGDVQRESLETFAQKGQDSEIHPEVQRDIFLYHSYCAIKNFMEAVTSSVEEDSNKDNLEIQPDRNPTKLSTVTSKDASSEFVLQQEPYCTEVANKLEAGKAHLAQVFPLTYRVEVLENIFSLLFGTYEDLYEGRMQQNESDDLETMDEETRSLSTSNRTGSWESLASSVDLSVDVHNPLSPLKDQDKLSSPVSLPQSPGSQQKHKEAVTPSGLESASRRQLFKHERSVSDPSLLKKLHTVMDADPHPLPAGKSQDDAVITRHSENDSFSGNVLSSKGSSRAAVSDDNDLKCEFVIDDEVVPDVLKTLKECLMELNAVKFTELKKGMSPSQDLKIAKN